MRYIRTIQIPDQFYFEFDAETPEEIDLAFKDHWDIDKQDFIDSLSVNDLDIIKTETEQAFKDRQKAERAKIFGND
mgnify:CR=1 FL=1|tara:strand:- start:2153 stop:2380 length:228 start_codon:yes stop_codon:yes gene_type:complete